MMRHRGAALALFVPVIALAGCSTYAASRYVASADTGQTLRAYHGKATLAVVRSRRRCRISAR